MSDKPSPKTIPSSFLSAAVSILFGSIALYLAIQLLRSIAGPLIILGVAFIALWTLWLLRRVRRRSDW